MAKVVALVVALCILAFATVSLSHIEEVFNVEGDVYCDPCRVQFQTILSLKLSGAKVRLDCISMETKAVTYSVEDVADENGHYKVQVVGDHQNDLCQVKAISSGAVDCTEPMSDFIESKIVCTRNSGLHTHLRYANPIGFMTKEASPQCLSVIQEYFTEG